MAAQSEMSDLPAYLQLFAALAAAPERRSMRRTGGAETNAIDPAIYIDPARFERERALIRRSPIVVAHASEIPDAGALLAHDHLGIPILLARGRDGAVRAFLNACRHRNTKLIRPGPALRKPSIVCPYHGWTYGLDGTLMNVPDEEHFPGLDKSCHGLVSLPCAVRGGLVFVVSDPGGVLDIDRALGSLTEDFAAFGLPTSVVFRKVERIKKTNWKLIVDAFQDGYHIQHLHRKSIAPYFKDTCAISERVGDNIRALVARLPFDEVKGLSPRQWDIREHASYSHYVFPNTVLIMHPDYISVIGLFPLSSGETMYVHSLLTPRIPQSDKERDHYERSFELIENGVFQAEDLDVCERAQAAIEGGARWPMTIGAYEQGIAQFHAILDEALRRA